MQEASSEFCGVVFKPVHPTTSLFFEYENDLAQVLQTQSSCYRIAVHRSTAIILTIILIIRLVFCIIMAEALHRSFQIQGPAQS